VSIVKPLPDGRDEWHVRAKRGHGSLSMRMRWRARHRWHLKNMLA